MAAVTWAAEPLNVRRVNADMSTAIASFLVVLDRCLAPLALFAEQDFEIFASQCTADDRRFVFRLCRAPKVPALGFPAVLV
jgi:hypothetical protein